MQPAFSSPHHMAAFSVLLAVLLALPAVIARTDWLNRRDTYLAIPWKYGPFSWIQQKIFAESDTADLVFMGSSHIWNGIDTPYVQRYFSKHLGREARIFSLCWRR